MWSSNWFSLSRRTGLGFLRVSRSVTFMCTYICNIHAMVRIGCLHITPIARVVHAIWWWNICNQSIETSCLFLNWGVSRMTDLNTKLSCMYMRACILAETAPSSHLGNSLEICWTINFQVWTFPKNFQGFEHFQRISKVLDISKEFPRFWTFSKNFQGFGHFQRICNEFARFWTLGFG